ncbi:hypothetical protein D1122_18285 [Cereibacter sphaeroides]|nr:hypothetical protein D1122_18285 [Cereibacter sphaeroides]
MAVCPEWVCALDSRAGLPDDLGVGMSGDLDRTDLRGNFGSATDVQRFLFPG